VPNPETVGFEIKNLSTYQTQVSFNQIFKKINNLEWVKKGAQSLKRLGAWK